MVKQQQPVCACTVPDELSGDWYNYKGLLSFNSSYIRNYPIFISATVSSLDFECWEQSGSLYMFKSTTTATVFSLTLYFYVCFEFHRVSEYKYYYYIGTTLSGTNNDYVFGYGTNVNATMSLACDRSTPYETGTYAMLVKKGAAEAGLAEATLPSDLLSKYSNTSLSSYDGSSTCTDSTYDGCSDKTKLSFNISSSCSSSLKLSTDGSYVSLFYITSGTLTYVHTWNNDTTISGSASRFSCFVYSTSGTNIYATQVADFCSDVSQNATNVASPGVVHVFTSRTETCVVSETGQSYLMYYLIIGLGIAFIIIVIVLIIICIKCKICQRCKERRRRKSTSKSSIFSNNKVGSLETIKGSNHYIMNIPPIRPMLKMDLLYKSDRTSRTGIGSRASIGGSMVSLNSVFNIKMKS